MSAAEQATKEAEIADAERRSKGNPGGIIGTATDNSLKSSLNYGSGLGQYGWGCINEVEHILSDYKDYLNTEAFSEENIKKSIANINKDLSLDIDADKLCGDLLKDGVEKIDQQKWSSSFMKHSGLDKKSLPQGEREKILQKFNEEYKKITQASDIKYEEARKKLADEFYKHPVINKLSSLSQSLEGMVATLGFPFAFAGHVFGALIKNYSANVMPRLARNVVESLKHANNKAEEESHIELGKDSSRVVLGSESALKAKNQQEYQTTNIELLKKQPKLILGKKDSSSPSNA